MGHRSWVPEGELRGWVTAAALSEGTGQPASGRVFKRGLWLHSRPGGPRGSYTRICPSMHALNLPGSAPRRSWAHCGVGLRAGVSVPPWSGKALTIPGVVQGQPSGPRHLSASSCGRQGLCDQSGCRLREGLRGGGLWAPCGWGLWVPT